MIKFTANRLQELKNSFIGKKIAVVGDMMLDGYFWGDVKRISPEAPVPIVEIDNQFFRFGGAANVVLNVEKLGAIPFPFGIIGNDSEGKILNGLFRDNNVNYFDGLITDDSRPTTVKIRVIASNQQIVRIDKELKTNVSSSVEDKIIYNFNKIIDEIDAVILEDYNKGVLTQRVVTEIISIAKSHNKIVTVDPKFSNFFLYQNVDVFKPNRKELEDALGKRFENQIEIENAARELADKLNANYILLTQGEKGSVLIGKDETMRVPTKARKVADVSGAGDTVISTLTVALCAGANITEAAYLANYAGGLVCEEVGIIPIKSEQLFDELMEEIK